MFQGFCTKFHKNFSFVKKELQNFLNNMYKKENWYKNSHQHGIVGCKRRIYVGMIAMDITQNLLALICYVLRKSFYSTFLCLA